MIDESSARLDTNTQEYLRSVRACNLPGRLLEEVECWIENWDENAIWDDLEHEQQERRIRCGVIQELQSLTGIYYPTYEQETLMLKEVDDEIALAESKAEDIAKMIPLDHAKEALNWVVAASEPFRRAPNIAPDLLSILSQLNVSSSGALQIVIDHLRWKEWSLSGHL